MFSRYFVFCREEGKLKAVAVGITYSPSSDFKPIKELKAGNAERYYEYVPEK